MKKSIVMITTGVLLLSVFSCSKNTNSNPTNPSDPQNLNGTWIIGDYTQIRLGKDSILLHEGWIEDTTAITDPGWSKWIHPTDSFLRLSTNESDTTWLYYAYIGDGYCCNVQTINISASSYLTGDTIVVNSNDYLIVEHTEDIDVEYRYAIVLSIQQPYNGCYEDYILFKRAND